MAVKLTYQEAFECVVSTLLLGREDIINKKTYCYNYILSIPRLEQMYSLWGHSNKEFTLAKPKDDMDLMCPDKRFVQIPLFYNFHRYSISNECSSKKLNNTYEKLSIEELEDSEVKSFIKQRTVKFQYDDGELRDAYEFFKPDTSIFFPNYHRTWIRMKGGATIYYIPYIESSKRQLLFSKYPDWKQQAEIERKSFEEM